MSQVQGTPARLRPVAALILLGLFLAAAQLAPLTHLATHQNDHTHGPEPEDVAHAAHRAEQAHEHGAPAPAATAAVARGGAPDAATAPAPAAPVHEHGRGSSAHFDLATIDGPAPPYLPPPAETQARPLDAPLGGHADPADAPATARGPPTHL